jgi:hypothetical protein
MQMIEQYAYQVGKLAGHIRVDGSFKQWAAEVTASNNAWDAARGRLRRLACARKSVLHPQPSRASRDRQEVRQPLGVIMKLTLGQARKMLPPFARALGGPFITTVIALRDSVDFELRACAMGDNPLTDKQVGQLKAFMEKTK